MDNPLAASLSDMVLEAFQSAPDKSPSPKRRRFDRNSKNPLDGHDAETPLTESLERAYDLWLRALAQDPLNDRDVHSICAHCKYGNLGIMQARDLIMKGLSRECLLTEDYIPNSKVGVDPRNRNDLGGNWNTAHDLMATVKRVGWSDAETKNAVCVQIIPGDTSVEKYNQILVEDVPLKPVKTGELTHSSISCSHTTLGLRAIEAACPNSDPLISENKKLSKTWIAKTDQAFATAVDRGLKWQILHYAVRTKYPEALVILIAAYNVYGSVQQKTCEVQGLMEMYKMAKQFKDCGKLPDWDHIKAALLKKEPPFAEDIDFLSQFLVGKAGDDDAVTFLQCFVASHRQFVPAKKRIPGEVFGALADFPLVNVAWAVCLTSYCGDASPRAKGNVCDFVSAASVRGLQKKLLLGQFDTHKCVKIANSEKTQEVVQEHKTTTACVASEVILLQVKARLKAAGLPEQPEFNNRLNKCLTWLQESLIRFILDKPQRNGREVTHLHGCAWQFLEDVQQEFADVDGTTLSQTWPKSAKAASPKKKTCAASSSRGPHEQHVYAMDSFGVVVDPIAKLRANNFDIGSMIGKKEQEDSRFTIVSVNELDVVTLKPWFPEGSDDAASANQTENMECLLRTFELKKTAGAKVRHAGWVAVRPVEQDVQIMYERGYALWAVSKISEHCIGTFTDVFEKVECLFKPKQMAIAKAECPAGYLIIAPESLKVCACETVKLDEVATDTRARVTLVNAKLAGYTFYASPWIKKKRAAAFWFVETTDDPSKANMSYAVASYDVTAGAELTAPTGVKLGYPPLEPAASAPTKISTKTTPQDKVAHPPDEAHKHIVRVRTLVNHKALKKNDVLMVWEKAEKRGDKAEKRGAEGISLAKVMRKR